MRKRSGFTLVEVLIVIGIILVLISILVPVINGARQQGNAAVCQSHLRALAQGLVAFAADHDGRMPGCWQDDSSTDPSHWDWLQGNHATEGGNLGEPFGPQDGTLFPYVNHQYTVYLCPALTLADNGMNNGPGGGSNGRYDYTAFEYFSGCHISRLPHSAVLRDVTTGNNIPLPCPTITEESNNVNAANKDPNHAESDKMGTAHWGGGYYIATDFSVQYWIEPAADDALNYWANSSRGIPIQIGDGNNGGPVKVPTSYGPRTWGCWEQW